MMVSHYHYTAPDDYTNQVQELTFDSDNSERCVEFSIMQDGVDEDTEAFTATLESSDNVIFTRDSTTVEIMDSDSMSIIQ